MVKALKRVYVLMLCLLLPLGAPLASEEELTAAEDLTAYCHLEAPKHVYIFQALQEHTLPINERFTKGQTIRVTWDENVSPKWLCIQWAQMREGVLLRQLDRDGNLISEDTVPAYFNTPMELMDGASEAVLIAGEAGMVPENISLYSPGVLPDPYHLWEETPETLDYFVIAAHSDDDLLFMGAVNPVYSLDRGYRGIVVFVTTQSRRRVNEAENGVWTSGSRYRPIFLGFADVTKATENVRAVFNEDLVALALVRLFRQYRPKVMFTHDLDGEYGNWQHRVTAAAAIEAYRLAADPAYDPQSAAEYGIWQIQKLYIHLYPENPLTIEMDSPLDSLRGKTAFELASEAYAKHISQLARAHKMEGSDDEFACNKFGMIAGQVEAGEDAFANIYETPGQFLIRAFRRLYRAIRS